MFNAPVPTQPSPETWHFIDELKKPLWSVHAWNPRLPRATEISLVEGVLLETRFPDAEQVLETAFADFAAFCRAGKIPTDRGYTISIAQGNVKGQESYRISITPQNGTITAEDSEGVRRAIFALEDLMLKATGPFLPLGDIERYPFIQNRISRCFFGPIKRPPMNRDELLDDVDYYPDEYLNRLAHEGVNGLWLTIEFRDLCRSAIAPEHGKDADRRLEKLRRTVDKCRRYGIRTYVFCIEPRAWEAANPTLEAHPELGRHRIGGQKVLFCPFSETAQQYLYECTHDLFTRVPNLGGLINITHGERPTTCLSAVAATGAGSIGCPVCAEKEPWEIIYASLSAMEKGLHDANPDAQLISWLYMPQPQGMGHHDLACWVYDIPAHTPPGVILQFNFESGVQQDRFGKTVTGGDYWISEPGPSPRFETVAKTAARHGTDVSAKIQTGCSHEVATVPFVPVPGLLYRKFSAMRKLGVSSSMLCWYFGNYPGLMNRAAGCLSFEPFPETERQFLEQLAATDWGDSAPRVADAWERFAVGYGNFPLTNLFQYYGPMHDGPVWPLHPEPQDTRLIPTWYLADKVTLEPFPPSGDRIGEAFAPVYELHEIRQLCDEMSSQWDEGLDICAALPKDVADIPDRTRDLGVAEALGIQFRSGRNIVHFYELRERLFRSGEDASLRNEFLTQMRTIAEEELRGNMRLLELCDQDSTLGFHSEAEGYKYYPGKIQWRMGQLQHLLDNELPVLRKKIAAGAPLFPEYTGATPTGCTVHCPKLPDGTIPTITTVFQASAETAENSIPSPDGWNTRWACGWTPESLWFAFECEMLDALPPADTPPKTFSIDELYSHHAVVVKIEPRRLWPCLRYGLDCHGTVLLPHASEGAAETSNGRSWKGILSIPFAGIPDSQAPGSPLRIDVQRIIPGHGIHAWMPQHPWPARLRLGADNPADLAWLCFAD